MTKRKEMLKKTVSTLVTLCLMLGVANIPVYAAATMVTPNKTTDAELMLPYYTPAQTVQQTTNGTNSKSKEIASQTNESIDKLLKDKTTGATAKNWLTQAKAIVNDIVNSNRGSGEKEILLNQALTSIKAVSNAKTSLLSLVKASSSSPFDSLSSIVKGTLTYRIYAKYGEKGVTATEVIAKKLGIDQSKVFDTLVKAGATKEEVSKIGSNISNVTETIDKLLKDKATGATAKNWLTQAKILIKNIFLNNKTASEKDKLLNQALTSIKAVSNAKTSLLSLVKASSSSPFDSLSNIVKGTLTYRIYAKYGEKGVTATEAIAKKLGTEQAKVFNMFAEMGTTKEQMDKIGSVGDNAIKTTSNIMEVIDNLLNAKTTGALARTWLAKAKTVIGDILLSNKTAKEKETSLNQALTSIKAVSSAKATLMSLIKQSMSGAFNPLMEVVKPTLTYRMYVKYGEEGVNAIAAMATKLGADQGKIFDKFVNSGVNKEQIKKISTTVSNIADIIDNLSKANTTGALARTWLAKAKTVIGDILLSNKTIKEKETLLNQALTSIKAVSSAKATLMSLIKQSMSGAFNPLSEVVKPTLTYRMYVKYGENGVNAIAAMATKLGADQGEIFNMFVEEEASANQVNRICTPASNIADTINSLLKSGSISSLTRTWLTQAKTLVKDIVLSDGTLGEKEGLLIQALNGIKEIEREGATITSLSKKTVSGVYSPLDSVLRKDNSYIDYKMNYMYGQKGISAIRELANKLGLSQNTVFFAFEKIGVTSRQMEKAAPAILTYLNKGERFINCAAVAVAKYLNISTALAAVQNLAGEIVRNVDSFVKESKSNKIFSATSFSERKTLEVNGRKDADSIEVDLATLMSSLQPGEKALISLNCYNRQGKYVSGHAITIEKINNNRYAVYDILMNNGDKIIYNVDEFKKLMNGQSARGETESGKSITKSVYLPSALGDVRYDMELSINGEKSGKIYLTTDAQKLPGVLRNKYKENIVLINKLLKTEGISPLATKWLNGARRIINEIYSSDREYNEKKELLRQTERILKEVEKENLSTNSLIKESSSQASYRYTVFSSLTKIVLKKDIAYKIYTKYDAVGVEMVELLSDKLNLSQTEIYNVFVENNLTKEEMKIMANHKYSIESNKDRVYTLNFWNDFLYPNVGKNLVALKQLADKK